LVEDARGQGASIVLPFGGDKFGEGRWMPPVLIINPPINSDAMTTEIFGPVLPVISYASSAEAIAFVKARPRPLALYWFGKNKLNRDEVLHRTHAGGVTMNGTIWHIAQANLPFGGIGHSGIGSYHGETGFVRFTHEKPIFYEHWLSGTSLLRPPFGSIFEFVLKCLRAIT
jgi:coniferyl-aldehyde dehydrogenase